MPLQGNPTSPLVGGNSARATILEGYVFQSGIHKPEMSNILSYKYPQYTLTAMLDRLGATEGVAQNVYHWDTLDRTRENGTVKATTGLVAGGTTSDQTAQLILDGITYDSANFGYFLVGDVVRFDIGDLGRVTATAANAGEQEITVQKIGTGNWTATMVAGTTTLGHAFSLFPEASDAPQHRLYLPTEDYNRLSIIRRSLRISGSEFTNRTYIGDGSAWYFTQEELEMKEFKRDIENAIVFGQLEDDGVGGTAGVYASRGILDWAFSEGIATNYVGATGVSEANLRSHIQNMLIEGTSDEIYVLCGAKFLADIQVALRDYSQAGAMSYGSFGNNTAGLDFQSYKFLGKTIHFSYYELFDDVKLLPHSGSTATSDKINFSDFALFLDLGTDVGGKKLITLKHKELNGQSRKFIHGIEAGMMQPDGSNGGQVASGFDGFRIHYIAECGLEVRLANRLGVMYATS